MPMRLFAPVLAFVDLETTGTGAATDAITEIGIVRVEADPEGVASPRVTEWSTLVNPGMPIPPEIQALTGITNAMVRDAPPFARIADEVAARTAGALFVAHNARFDYGFLKHAFARRAARLLRAGAVHGPAVAAPVSRRVAAQPGQRDRAARAAGGRATPRARRRARAVDVRAGALPRSAAGSDRSGREARPQDAEPSAAARARRARRAAGGARRLPLLRPQCAAAVHRQEHEPARARGRAFLVGLSLARPTFASRRSSSASSSRRRPAKSARCCAKPRS